LVKHEICNEKKIEFLKKRPFFSVVLRPCGFMASKPEWKATVWAYLDHGDSHSEVRTRLKGKISPSAISRYISDYVPGWQNLDLLHDKPRSGRPPKVTAAQRKQILDGLRAGYSTRTLAIRLELNHTTVGLIAKRSGLMSAKKVKKPSLTRDNIAARLRFAEKMSAYKTPWWRSVLWTDECPIPLTPNVTDNEWREVGTPAKFQFFEKNSGSLWIWAGISWKGVTPVIFLNHNIGGKFTARRYIEQVLKKVPTMLRGKLRGLSFMEDGSPVHTAKICSQFRSQRNIRKFPLDETKWPARSPDLHPIENLWSHLKRKLRRLSVYPTTKDSIMRAIQKIWKTYDVSFVRKYLSGYRRRLEACILSKGGATKY